MGSNMTKVSSGHGLSGSSKGHPMNMGVTGPGGKFGGTVNPQDITRKVSESQVGDDSGPRNPKIGGIKNLSRTGGQGRKFAGKVGFEKATGTN